MGPSALSASADVTGSISAQQLPASRHSQRAQPVPAGSERRPMHAWSSVVAALPLTRHAAWAAADLAATHTAPGGSDLPIEGARTHAPTISMGVLPVFLRFGGSARARGARGGGRGRGGRRCTGFRSFPYQVFKCIHILKKWAEQPTDAGAWLTGSADTRARTHFADDSGKVVGSIPAPPHVFFSEYDCRNSRPRISRPAGEGVRIRC